MRRSFSKKDVGPSNGPSMFHVPQTADKGSNEQAAVVPIESPCADMVETIKAWEDKSQQEDTNDDEIRSATSIAEPWHVDLGDRKGAVQMNEPPLIKQRLSSKRLMDTVGHTIHQLTSSGGRRRSFFEASVTKALNRMSPARSAVDAGLVEQELNILATNYVSKLAQENQAYVMSIHSYAKVWWDAFIALVTAYAIIIVPVDLSFELYHAYNHLSSVQWFVDIIFLVDILLVFRTSYLVRDSREEVFDVDLIRRNYLAKWFWVDCLASLPSSVLGEDFHDSDFAYLRLLVLLKVLRLATSPTYAEFMAWASRTLTPYVVRLVVLVVLYLLLHHYIACSFHFLVEYEGGPDTPNLWDMPFKSNDTLGVKYVSSFYRGLDCTSGSDLGPMTSLERIWGTMAFTIGILSNACIAGICASIMAQMNKVEDEQRAKHDMIDACLHHHQVARGIQSQIKEFYDSAYSHESAHHADELFQGMPEKLHFELSIVMNESFLNKVPLFQTLDSEGVVALMECVEETVAMTGDLIIRAGEEGRALYVIKLGTVEVYDNRGPRGARVSIKHMKAGDFFGEMSLIRQGTASANVVATSFCVLLVIYKKIFDWITRENAGMKHFMEMQHKARLNEAKEARRVTFDGRRGLLFITQPIYELEANVDPRPKGDGPSSNTSSCTLGYARAAVWSC
ncbi:unnamed protein product [Aphanomyces euteiches]